MATAASVPASIWAITPMEIGDEPHVGRMVVVASDRDDDPAAWRAVDAGDQSGGVRRRR